MYKISKQPEQTIPEIADVIMKLLLHPNINPEGKIFLCYFLREYKMNPLTGFSSLGFQKRTNVKRVDLEKAMFRFVTHHILIISTQQNESVYTLDWNKLLEYMDDETITIPKRRHFMRNKDEESED